MAVSATQQGLPLARVLFEWLGSSPGPSPPRRDSMIKKVVALAAALAFVIQPVSGTNLAQAQQAKQQLHLEGLSRQASPAAKGVLFDPSDAVVLLLDHQTGLFQTVNDVPVNV